MPITPWRTIATPHKDVREGASMSDFAAHLLSVARGKGAKEYQNPETFFKRTCLTNGMRDLLSMVLQRIGGEGGEPVVQLQTGFGGGKTHSLLAIYHLLTAENPEKLKGIDEILQKAKTARPSVRVVVLDGDALSPSEPRKKGKITINTLGGELAYRLGGAEGYAMVQNADRDGTSPGSDILTELLKRNAPCVILVDELANYMRQFGEKEIAGGSFDTNIAFIKALTESVQLVPNAALLVTLPEKNQVAEAGGASGQLALDSLSGVFQRVRKVWQHMSSDEAYQAVIRRLFEEIDEKKRDKECKKIAAWYRENADYFPPEASEAAYEQKLRECYPFHPHLFRLLYTEWGALANFQKTRGVLKLMAPIIQKLWSDNHRNALLTAGDLPLDDGGCRSGFVTALQDSGWDPVIDHDIDGDGSVAKQLEKDHPNTLGKYGASCRMARTVFLGSAPSFRDENRRGIEEKSALLAGVLPEEPHGVHTDALEKLADKCHYLQSIDGRYWFGTHANLQKQMEEYKQNLEDTEVSEVVQRRLSENLAAAGASRNGLFQSIHVFTPHSDIPDDTKLRLVALPLDAAYSPAGVNHAEEEIHTTLAMRGETARTYKNNFVFLAPRYDTVGVLKNAARELVAWKLVEENETLTDITQTRQVERKQQSAQNALETAVRDSYSWLLTPADNADKKGYEIARAEVRQQREKFADNVTDCCAENEWVIRIWAYIHLKALLEQHYWNNERADIAAAKLWENIRQFYYMPRLKNQDVLLQEIYVGVKNKEFGVALNGKNENGEYDGFVFGHDMILPSVDNLLIIPPEIARQEEERRASLSEPPPPGPRPPVPPPPGPGPHPPVPPPGTKHKRFHGFVHLTQTNVRVKVSEICDELLQHLGQDADAKVDIVLEISAENEKGFDTETQRTVEENAATLGFEEAEFSEE